MSCDHFQLNAFKYFDLLDDPEIDVGLALELGREVHNRCWDAPYDIGLTLANIVAKRQREKRKK